MIKVLVVEDSLSVRELLCHMLESDPDVRVIGKAANGLEAMEFLSKSTGQRPDIVTMDIHMPVMDGLEATRRIMQSAPLPIVVVSAAWKPAEVALTFQAMEAGALAIIEKPAGPAHPQYEQQTRQLLQTVKLMSEVRVVKRRPRTVNNIAPKSSLLHSSPSSPQLRSSPSTPISLKAATTGQPSAVAVGASTGGPPALQLFLKNLPADFPLPILIVQHITQGFLDGLVQWLDGTTNFAVHAALPGEQVRGGHVYLAPDGHHMALDSGGRIALSIGPVENGSLPSVSHLFRSLATHHASATIGVLLTGMGRDGAAELKILKERGALTFAQDKASSVIFGMPGAAIEIGAATHVLPPDQIALAIAHTVAQSVSQFVKNNSESVNNFVTNS